MATELVAIPSDLVTAVTGRWTNYQTALKGGIGVLITTTRANLQTYALNPCSVELGRDPTPPDGWEFLASATKPSGQTVTDTVSIYPGVRKQPDGTLMLEYPA